MFFLLSGFSLFRCRGPESRAGARLRNYPLSSQNMTYSSSRFFPLGTFSKKIPPLLFYRFYKCSRSVKNTPINTFFPSKLVIIHSAFRDGAAPLFLSGLCCFFFPLSRDEKELGSDWALSGRHWGVFRYCVGLPFYLRVGPSRYEKARFKRTGTRLSVLVFRWKYCTTNPRE